MRNLITCLLAPLLLVVSSQASGQIVRWEVASGQYDNFFHTSHSIRWIASQTDRSTKAGVVRGPSPTRRPDLRPPVPVSREERR